MGSDNSKIKRYVDNNNILGDGNRFCKGGVGSKATDNDSAHFYIDKKEEMKLPEPARAV